MGRVFLSCRRLTAGRQGQAARAALRAQGRRHERVAKVRRQRKRKVYARLGGGAGLEQVRSGGWGEGGERVARCSLLVARCSLLARQPLDSATYKSPEKDDRDLHLGAALSIRRQGLGRAGGGSGSGRDDGDRCVDACRGDAWGGRRAGDQDCGRGGGEGRGGSRVE